MRELIIAPQKEGKGRSFSAVHLAHLEADSLWPGGQTSKDSIRPVWLQVGGTEAEMRPFVANLMLGRKAILGKGRKDTVIELMKSSKYRFDWQRVVEKRPDGKPDVTSIVTAYLPDLFRMDLGMVDLAGVRFCLLPTCEWVASSTIDPGPAVAHVRATYGKVGVPLTDEALAELVPVAVLFASFLDRRSRCPLISDVRFYLQMFCAALAQGIAAWTRENTLNRWGCHSYYHMNEVGIDDVRLFVGVSCMCSHEALEAFLAEQVRIYFEVTNGKA
jgi:hypothetical protein